MLIISETNRILSAATTAAVRCVGLNRESRNERIRNFFYVAVLHVVVSCVERFKI